MKLLEIWKRIGKQPLKTTQNTEAIVFLKGHTEEYKVSKIRYEKGKLIGFEVEPGYHWYSEMIPPEENKYVVVRDDHGNEYHNHTWNGFCWYSWVIGKDGADGWRSDVDVVSWRYQ